jgi:hypothetical protein
MKTEKAIKRIFQDLVEAFKSLEEVLSVDKHLSVATLIPEHVLAVKAFDRSLNQFRDNLEEILKFYKNGKATRIVNEQALATHIQKELEKLKNSAKKIKVLLSDKEAKEHLSHQNFQLYKKVPKLSAKHIFHYLEMNYLFGKT